MPVNNIMLDTTPKEDEKEEDDPMANRRESMAMTEEAEELPPIESPRRINPQNTAAYESVSVDIKCQSISDAYSRDPTSSEHLGTQVHPIDETPDKSDEISNEVVDDLF